MSEGGSSSAFGTLDLPSKQRTFLLYDDNAGTVDEVAGDDAPPPAVNLEDQQRRDLVDITRQCKWCPTVCKIGATISCGLIALLICPALGPGVKECVLIASAMCSKPSELGCNEYCDAAHRGYYEFDWHNCGACGNQCGDDQECCNGTCANLMEDPNNCLGCGVKCPGGEVCCFGVCRKVDQCCPPDNPQCRGIVRCSCTGDCYMNIDTCLRECSGSLGCFTGICGPAGLGDCKNGVVDDWGNSRLGLRTSLVPSYNGN